MACKWQEVTPKSLNEMPDEGANGLFARIDAVLATADAADADARPRVAPFVTKALALRVHNRIADLRKQGACALSKQAALALVVLDLVGVVLPGNIGEIEQIGDRWDNRHLKDHAADVKAIKRRGNAAETKQRQIAAAEQELLPWPFGEWPAAGTRARVKRVKQRVELTGAGATLDDAVRLLTRRIQPRLQPVPQRL